MEPFIHRAFKAIGFQKPCVVMKRTDAIYPVQLRLATETKGGLRKLLLDSANAADVARKFADDPRVPP